jgi:TonB family protein
MYSNVFAIAGCLTLATLLPAQPPPLRLSSEIQEQRLIYRVRPVYPKLAKQARIQGTVWLAALIDEFGSVEQLKLISGHPLLVKAAFDAVKQWRYIPATYNGVPVRVATTISLTFSMGIGEGQPDWHRIIRLNTQITGLYPALACTMDCSPTLQP